MRKRAALLLFVSSFAALVSRAEDAPQVKLGGTIFADWTRGSNLNAFNLTRAYLNVTGRINPAISFRITPDIVRDTLTYRMKYAYGQFDLDRFTTKGSWIRFGLQQTPWIDYEESIYRYRFQGPVFADREGFLTSSDFGAAVHWTFPADSGDLHVGVYNGEGYTRSELNNQKSVQLRAAVRPFSRAGVWNGLRVAAFVDQDHSAETKARRRAIASATFEHSFVNAGAEWLQANDAGIEARGYTLWATPKLPRNFEVLLRHDELKPDRNASATRKRNIAGIAYWFPQRSGVTSALLADYDSLSVSDRPRDTRWGVKLLVNF
jgi:hypothetical protein